jgi:hypothetical protein
MDLGQITAAVSSLKIAGEIAKGLIDLKTGAEVQAKAIELNQKIIDAQHQIFAANATQTTLVERIRELEKEIAAMKAWDAEKQRYQMASPFTGATVFAVKKAMSNGEPAHYLCANCFKAGKPSILQNSQTKDGWAMLICSGCKSEVRTRWRNLLAAKYAEDVVTEG